MKPTIQQISKAKFWRLKEAKGSKPVLAKVFVNATWDCQDAYSAFEHKGYVYAMMRTSEPDFKTCFKRYPVGYATKEKCLLVSKMHRWI